MLIFITYIQANLRHCRLNLVARRQVAQRLLPVSQLASHLVCPYLILQAYHRAAHRQCLALCRLVSQPRSLEVGQLVILLRNPLANLAARQHCRQLSLADSLQVIYASSYNTNTVLKSETMHALSFFIKGEPSGQPSIVPTAAPSGVPTAVPSGQPTEQPSDQPTSQPTGLSI